MRSAKALATVSFPAAGGPYTITWRERLVADAGTRPVSPWRAWSLGPAEGTGRPSGCNTRSRSRAVTTLIRRRIATRTPLPTRHPDQRARTTQAPSRQVNTERHFRVRLDPAFGDATADR